MLLAYNKNVFSYHWYVVCASYGNNKWNRRIFRQNHSKRFFSVYLYIHQFVSFSSVCEKKSTWLEMKTIATKHPVNIVLTSLLSIGSWLIFLIVLQQTNVSQTLPIYKSLSYVTPVIFGILLLVNGYNYFKSTGVIIGIAGIFFSINNHNIFLRSWRFVPEKISKNNPIIPSVI